MSIKHVFFYLYIIFLNKNYETYKYSVIMSTLHINNNVLSRKRGKEDELRKKYIIEEAPTVRRAP